jgi:hypothetical protein
MPSPTIVRARKRARNRRSHLGNGTRREPRLKLAVGVDRHHRSLIHRTRSPSCHIRKIPAMTPGCNSRVESPGAPLANASGRDSREQDDADTRTRSGVSGVEPHTLRIDAPLHSPALALQPASGEVVKADRKLGQSGRSKTRPLEGWDRAGGLQSCTLPHPRTADPRQAPHHRTVPVSGRRHEVASVSPTDVVAPGPLALSALGLNADDRALASGSASRMGPTCGATRPHVRRRARRHRQLPEGYR